MFDELLLVLAQVTDALVACFACGADGIRIPWRSSLLMSGLGTGFLAISLAISGQIRKVLPPGICSALSFFTLLAIGVISLFQNTMKSALSRCADLQKRLHFKWAGLSFAITIYLDETRADADHSKSLSLREALFLGTILSLDSFGIGLGSGLTPQSLPLLCGLSVILHLTAIQIGQYWGRRSAGHLPNCFSCAGGALLILLAFLRLF